MNLFWPVYLKLEQVLDRLTHDLHFGDDHSDVYSSTFADLILRAGSEIEALSKTLFSENIDPKVELGRFDEDALLPLATEWRLPEKVVINSHPNCFFSQKIHYPFAKDTKKTKGKGSTYNWNNAYQNLKHNRKDSFPSASLGNTISALSALFVLNLYYKNDIISLNKSDNASSLDDGFGSKFFSTQIATTLDWDESGNGIRTEEEEKSIYIIDQDPETAAVYYKQLADLSSVSRELMITNPAYLDATINTPEGERTPEHAGKILSPKILSSIASTALQLVKPDSGAVKLQASLNKEKR